MHVRVCARMRTRLCVWALSLDIELLQLQILGYKPSLCQLLRLLQLRRLLFLCQARRTRRQSLPDTLLRHARTCKKCVRA